MIISTCAMTTATTTTATAISTLVSPTQQRRQQEQTTTNNTKPLERESGTHSPSTTVQPLLLRLEDDEDTPVSVLSPPVVTARFLNNNDRRASTMNETTTTTATTYAEDDEAAAVSMNKENDASEERTAKANDEYSQNPDKMNQWKDIHTTNELTIAKDQINQLQKEIASLKEDMTNIIKVNELLQATTTTSGDSAETFILATDSTTSPATAAAESSNEQTSKEMKKAEKKALKKKLKEDVALAVKRHLEEVETLKKSHATQLSVLKNEIKERALDMESIFTEFHRLKQVEQTLYEKGCKRCQRHVLLIGDKVATDSSKEDESIKSHSSLSSSSPTRNANKRRSSVASIPILEEDEEDGGENSSDSDNDDCDSDDNDDDDDESSTTKVTTNKVVDHKNDEFDYYSPHATPSDTKSVMSMEDDNVRKRAELLLNMSHHKSTYRRRNHAYFDNDNNDDTRSVYSAQSMPATLFGASSSPYRGTSNNDHLPSPTAQHHDDGIPMMVPGSKPSRRSRRTHGHSPSPDATTPSLTFSPKSTSSWSLFGSTSSFVGSVFGASSTTTSGGGTNNTNTNKENVVKAVSSAADTNTNHHRPQRRRGSDSTMASVQSALLSTGLFKAATPTPSPSSSEHDRDDSDHEGEEETKEQSSATATSNNADNAIEDPFETSRSSSRFQNRNANMDDDDDDDDDDDNVVHDPFETSSRHKEEETKEDDPFETSRSVPHEQPNISTRPKPQDATSTKTKGKAAYLASLFFSRESFSSSSSRSSNDSVDSRSSNGVQSIMTAPVVATTGNRKTGSTTNHLASASVSHRHRHNHGKTNSGGHLLKSHSVHGGSLYARRNIASLLATKEEEEAVPSPTTRAARILLQSKTGSSASARVFSVTDTMTATSVVNSSASIKMTPLNLRTTTPTEGVGVQPRRSNGLTRSLHGGRSSRHSMEALLRESTGAPKEIKQKNRRTRRTSTSSSGTGELSLRSSSNSCSSSTTDNHHKNADADKLRLSDTGSNSSNSEALERRLQLRRSLLLEDSNDDDRGGVERNLVSTEKKGNSSSNSNNEEDETNSLFSGVYSDQDEDD